MSVDLTINGHVYKTGRLNAKQQFHVARRLLPVISSLAGIITKSPNGDGDNGALLQALADALSHIPDKDCDYVLSVCLSVCQRQQAGGWANVWNVAADQAQFADVDLSVMVQLVMATLQDNLGSFTAALPQVSLGMNPIASGPLSS